MPNQSDIQYWLNPVKKPGLSPDAIGMARNSASVQASGGARPVQNTVKQPSLSDFQKTYLNYYGIGTELPDFKDPEYGQKMDKIQQGLKDAEKMYRQEWPGFMDRPIISQESMQKNKNNPLYQVAAWLSSDLTNKTPATEEYKTGYKSGSTVMPWQLSPSEVLNAPETQLAGLAGAGSTYLPSLAQGTNINRLGQAANAAMDTTYGTSMLADTYSKRDQMTAPQLLANYALGTLGAVGGGAQLKSVLPKGVKPTTPKVVAPELENKAPEIAEFIDRGNSTLPEFNTTANTQFPNTSKSAIAKLEVNGDFTVTLDDGKVLSAKSIDDLQREIDLYQSQKYVNSTIPDNSANSYQNWNVSEGQNVSGEMPVSPTGKTAPISETTEFHVPETAPKTGTTKEPIVFYRGTKSGETTRIPTVFSAAEGKTFAARTSESARNYGENIEAITAKPNAKILYTESREFWNVIGKRKPANGSIMSLKGNLIDNINMAINKAKENGYDAISFAPPHDADIGTVILNEGAFIRKSPTPSTNVPGGSKISPVKQSPSGGASSPITAQNIGGAIPPAGGNKPSTTTGSIPGNKAYNIPKLTEADDLITKTQGEASKGIITKPGIKQIAGAVDPVMARGSSEPAVVLKAMSGKWDDQITGAVNYVVAGSRSKFAKVRAALKIDKDGMVHGGGVSQTTPLPDGSQSMAIHDIIEYADRYNMPASTRDAIESIRKASKDLSDMLEAEGILVRDPGQALKPGQFRARQGEADWQFLHRVINTVKEESAEALAGSVQGIINKGNINFPKLPNETNYAYLSRFVENIKTGKIPLSPEINKLADDFANLADVKLKKQQINAHRNWETVAQGMQQGIKYANDPILELEKQTRGAYEAVKKSRLTEATPRLIKTTTPLERAEQELGQSLDALSKSSTDADNLVNYIQRLNRHESLPGGVISSLRKKFPQLAARIDAATKLLPHNTDTLITKLANSVRNASVMNRSIYDDLVKKVKDAASTGDLKGQVGKLVDDMADSIADALIVTGKDAKDVAGRAQLIANIKLAFKPFGAKPNLTASDIIDALTDMMNGKKSLVDPIRKAVTSSLKTKFDTLKAQKALTVGDIEGVLDQHIMVSNAKADIVRDLYKKLSQRQVSELKSILDEAKQIQQQANNELKNFNTVKNAYAEKMGTGGTREYGQVVGVPGLSGRYIVSQDGKLGADLASELSQHFGYVSDSKAVTKIIDAAGKMGAAMRMFRLGFDASVIFIQNALALGYDIKNLVAYPVNKTLGRQQGLSFVWGKGVGNTLTSGFGKRLEHFQAWLDSPSIKPYAKDFIERGGLVEAAETVEAAADATSLINKLPEGKVKDIMQFVRRQTLGRSEAAFTTGRVTTAINMYKAGYKAHQLAGDLDDWAKMCNEMTGVLSSRGMGISKSQRSLESAIVFMSPRFTRANAAVITHILTNPKAYTSREAAESLIALATASFGAYALIQQAQGKDVVANPFDPDWGKVEIGDNKYYLGGIMADIRRLLAVIDSGVYQTTGGHISLSGKDDKTPLILTNEPNKSLLYSQFRSKTSPVTGTAIDIISGKDYNWETTTTTDTIKDWLTPAFVSPLTEGEGTAPVAASFAGISTAPIDVPYELSKDWKQDIDNYNAIPSSEVELQAAQKANPNILSREQYRSNYPDTDAKLFITGNVSTVKTYQSALQALKYINENQINPGEIAGIKDILDGKVTHKEPTITDIMVKALTGSESERQQVIAEINMRSQAEQVIFGVTDKTERSMLNKATDMMIKDGNFNASTLDQVKQILTPYYAIPTEEEIHEQVRGYLSPEEQEIYNHVLELEDVYKLDKADAILLQNPNIVKAKMVFTLMKIQSSRQRTDMRQQNPVLDQLIKMLN